MKGPQKIGDALNMGFHVEFGYRCIHENKATFKA